MSLIVTVEGKMAGISLGIYDMELSRGPLSALAPDHAKALKAFLGKAPTY
jgi:hypothetical protein